MKISLNGPVWSIYFIYSQYLNGFLAIELLYDAVSMSLKRVSNKGMDENI